MQEDFNRLQVINNFYISIDEQRFARRRTVPHQVRFEFNLENLDAIAQMQANNNSLSFDAKLLANLRYYSILQCHNIICSGLTFTSYYCQGEQKIAVISSNISAQGQISQKIRQDFFVNLPVLEKIFEAHYWSIEQILQQLPIASPKKNYFLSWILSILITSGVAVLIFYFLPNIFLVNLIAIIIVFSLIKLCFQYLIKNFLFKLILQQLLFGFLSYSSRRRQVGFLLLECFN